MKSFLEEALMLRPLAYLSTFTVAAVLVAPSLAAPIAIANADFEDGGATTGGFPQASSWEGSAQLAAHASFRNEAGTFGGGDNFVFNSTRNPPATQTLAATYTAETVYTLSAYLNYDQLDIHVDGILELGYDNGGGFVSLGSTTIDLEALADPQNPGAGTGWDLATADPISVLTGNAAVGEQIIIRIISTEQAGLWFDNVALDAIPEPASLALMGMGGLLMLRRRRMA